MRQLLSLILIGISLAGCSSLTAQKSAKLAHTRASTHSGELLTMPAQLRTYTLTPKNSDYIQCAEPMPDVAMSDSFRLISGLSADAVRSSTGGATPAENTVGATINNDLHTTTVALELAGRSQTVLLAREFLFRTCEGAANGLVDKESFVKFHQEILNQITGLVNVDKTKAVTSAAVSVAAGFPLVDPAKIGNAMDTVTKVIQDNCLSTYRTCVRPTTPDSKEEKQCSTELQQCTKIH